MYNRSVTARVHSFFAAAAVNIYHMIPCVSYCVIAHPNTIVATTFNFRHQSGPAASLTQFVYGGIMALPAALVLPKCTQHLMASVMCHRVMPLCNAM